MTAAGRPVAVGDPAPDFTLRNQDRQPVRLADFRGVREVLLVFYPLAFSGVCQGELAQLRDHHDEFVNDDTQALAISVDSPFTLKAWATRDGFAFPLLSDFWPHGAVARAYGVFDEEWGSARRATVLVDRGGIVRFTEVNPAGRPRDQDAWRRALHAVAEHRRAGVTPDTVG